MANKPRIRFRGFTEDWERRKFLDLLDTQNGIRRGPFGSSLKKDSFVKKSDCVVYEQQNAIYDNYVTRYFISKEKYNELIRFNIQPGDFIMSGAGTIGRISMVPDGIKKGVFNQALIRFKVDKNSVNPLYFLKFMQSDMMQKQLTQANPGSAMTNLVPMDELKKWDVTIPSLEEQNKISNFINQIDESITLHQCKLKKLNLAKKSLLQKLFPRNRSQIPGVRFKGFTDAWEQRKLESLFTKYEDKVNTPDSGYWRLGLRSHCKGTFHTYVDAGHELETTEMYRVKAGNFILNITFAWERALAVTDDEDQDKLVSHRFPQFKPNSDLVIDFFKHTLMDKRLKHHLELSSPGGAGRNKVLKVSDMLKYELLVPSIQEQNIISSFLNNIDHIITLHQRKLERLQEVKKGLLQKMFV